MKIMPTEKDIRQKSIDAKNIRREQGYSLIECIQYQDGFLDGIKWYQGQTDQALKYYEDRLPIIGFNKNK